MCKRGDIYYVDFGEKDGSKQGGVRPALVAVSYTHLDVYKRQINDRGIMVDQELIGHAVACDLLYKETVTKKAYEISGLENPNSVSQLKDWLNEMGI